MRNAGLVKKIREIRLKYSELNQKKAFSQENIRLSSIKTLMLIMRKLPESGRI